MTTLTSRTVTAAAMTKTQLVQMVINLEDNLTRAEIEILELKVLRDHAWLEYDGNLHAKLIELAKLKGVRV